MDSGLSLIEVTASAARTKPTLVGAAGVVPDGVGKLLDGKVGEAVVSWRN